MASDFECMISILMMTDELMSSDSQGAMNKKKIPKSAFLSLLVTQGYLCITVFASFDNFLLFCVPCVIDGRPWGSILNCY